MNLGLGNQIFADKRENRRRTGKIRHMKWAALTAASVFLAVSAVSFSSLASDYAVETIVLGEPEHVWWETDTVVKWSSVKNAREYQVKLFIADNADRDEENWKAVDFEDEGLETAAVIRTSSTSYDFSQYLDDLHTYFAAVRAVPQVKEQAYVQAGGWVGSPDVDFREKQVMGTTGGRWRNYLEGSRYQTEDGAYLTEGWQLIEGDWYLLDENGYRLCGWQNVDGARYYLGEDGRMASGWFVFENNWYYADDTGKMVTGWVMDKPGEYYYLQEDGTMAHDTVIDGYTLASDGLRTGKN